MDTLSIASLNAYIVSFFGQYPWLPWVILAWSLPWKAVALWKSAHRNQLIWFVVLFVANTLAVLEILYIFIFSKRKTSVDTESKNI